MLNTPLVDPESATMPKAIPMKTFYSSTSETLDEDQIPVYSVCIDGIQCTLDVC